MNAGAHDADRPEWFTIIDNGDLILLAGSLKRLLIMEAAKGTEPEEAPFVGYWKPVANDLLSLPILIALMADLPVSTSLDRAQQLIPVVRALLPDSGLRIVDCIKQHKDEAACLALVDALYAKAASDNSTFVAEVADVLLHRFAIIHRMTGLHHRLVQRFYEVYLAMRPALSSLHDCIIELAHAKLKVQRLAKGAPAHTVLNDGQGRSSYRNGSVLEQLAETVAVASKGYADLIAEWLKAKRSQVAETRPDLAEIWAEEDAPLRDNVGDASGKWSYGSRPVTSREKATIETLLEQLAELAVLVDQSIIPDDDQDEESGNGTMNTTGENPNTIGSTSKKGAEPSLKRSLPVPPKRRSIKTSATGRNRLASFLSRENAEADDPDDPDARRRFAQDADARKGPLDELGRETLMVLPYLADTSNRDLKERLQPYHEQLQQQFLPLVPTPDLAPVRTRLVHMLPHLETVIDRVLNATAPHKSVKIPPVLLVGAPGCGKTTLLEELVKLTGIPSLTFDAAGGADANFLGLDLRWSTGAAGVHLDLIMEHRIANPVIVVDELEKLGGSLRNGDARTRLLGLLEPRRAQAFVDPFLSVPLDLRAVSWAFTANSLDDIAPALKNRLEIIQCPSPAPKHLEQLAPQLLAAEYKSRGLGPEWAAALTPSEIDTLKAHWPGGSIRDLRRLMAAVIKTRDVFMARA